MDHKCLGNNSRESIRCQFDGLSIFPWNLNIPEACLRKQISSKPVHNALINDKNLNTKHLQNVSM